MPVDGWRTLEIPNRLSELTIVVRWVAAVMEEWSIPERTAYAIDLVVNEAVTNIINYAFPDDGVHQITIALRNADDSIAIRFEDSGRPFNPLAAPAMEMSPDLEHASIGGRGIHLIKSYSDEQNYTYVSGTNRLRLVVKKQH
jgi:anti-sigma regulatory factor (Ser/Thr protein kinase)